MMIPGLVSNCWQCQFEAGQSLVDLLGEARRRGYRAVELRQGSLAECEDDSGRPVLEALRQLPEQFPELQFDLAAALPFLSGDLAADSAEFSTWRTAAAAISASPHLRLVDLTTGTAESPLPRPDDVVPSLVRLAESMAAEDGLLSVEHSRQPWNWFYEIFVSARERLGDAADRLRLCLDPCNLLIPHDDVNPVAVCSSLSMSELSMVHFKQRRHGELLTHLAPGEIDFASIVRYLVQQNWSGPCLLEVRPGADFWAHARESMSYLSMLGADWDTA